MSQQTSDLRRNKLFQCEYDSFNGVIVTIGRDEQFESSDFEEILTEHLAEWKATRRRGVWLDIPINNSHLIPVAAAKGFTFHHVKPTYCVMTTWLEEGTLSSLPPYSGNNIGVGGFVVDESTNEVLVIKENRGPYLGWKFPGGSVDDGESLAEACVREIKEETGVDIEFKGIMLFRHTYPFRFDNGDTYYLCLCKPLSKKVIPDGREIAVACWKQLSDVEYIAKGDQVTPFLNEVLNAYDNYVKHGRLIVGERPAFAPRNKPIYTLFRMTGKHQTPKMPRSCSNCGEDMSSSIH